MVEVEVAAPPAAQVILNLMEQFYAEARYPFDREKARAALEPFLADPALGRAWLFRDGAAAVSCGSHARLEPRVQRKDAFVDSSSSLTHRGGVSDAERSGDRRLAASWQCGPCTRGRKTTSRGGALPPEGFEDHDRRLTARRFAGID
jgi:hypothetical protein